MTMNNTSCKNIRISFNGKWPLKKVNRIANRTFIVIDETLVKALSINENSTWLEQQAVENGILMKIHHPDTQYGKQDNANSNYDKRNETRGKGDHSID
jgi:hypothetical protein